MSWPMLTLLLPALVSDAEAGAKVSAFRKEAKLGANYYNGTSAIDGKLETAWMVPGESPNRGEWIELDLPKGTIDKIGIMPGWSKSEETFGDYSRIKKIRVDAFTLSDDQEPTQVGTAEVTVADQREWQVLDLPDMKVGEGSLFGGKVRISVVDIYDGEDFANFGVSELLVFLKEFDATAAISAVSASLDGHGPELATDGDPKSAWMGAAGAEFTVDPKGYGLGSIGLVSGSKDTARPKTVEVKSGNQVKTTVLPDKPGTVQWAEVPGFNGYTGGAFGGVTFTVVDTYPGAKAQDLAIAEIQFRATCLESL
jgi:hypothetical protein